MIRIDNIKISAKRIYDLKEYIAGYYKISGNISNFRILKKSVDARKKNDICFIYSVCLSLGEKEEKKLVKADKNITEYNPVIYKVPVSNKLDKKVVVIGMGPAGLFAAYSLCTAGFKPILIERGKSIENRIEDVNNYWSGGKLDPNSNVQFGEGGAGTFSDGKLNTGIKDKEGRIDFVLNTFYQFGAKENILYDSKPHIGTDVLREVITNMRKYLLQNGVRILFETEFKSFEINNGRLKGINVFDRNINEMINIECDDLIIATGHSSRDTFKYLEGKLPMEQKPFAMGFRVIHKQSFIDKSQYGDNFEDIYEGLEPSPYKLTYQSEDRGVYTFCMCPGGYVVNASSEEGRICVNGMSNQKRDSGYANSAVIVQIKPSDLESENVLEGMNFQQSIEEKTKIIGNNAIPVCNLKDFFENLSYNGNVVFDEFDIDINDAVKGQIKVTDITGIYPEFVNIPFCDAMCDFDRKIKGFAKSNPLVLASETRSSSPVKILRGEDYQADIKSIYPCGEGAGYAGGIVSAAIDGIKVAESIINKYNQ